MMSVDKYPPSDREQEGLMEAISYCRVSTEEQVKEGVSLAAQEARVRAYCAMAGLSLIDNIRDEGVSAARPLATRLGGAVLLRALARHQAQHVVVVTLDRAFRSTIDCLSTVQAWDRAGVSLHLVDHGGQSIATATAVGRMFLTMLACFAEMEKRLIGERTANAMRHKKTCHQAYARTPYGFDREGEVLRPNPVEQAVIRQVQDWQRAGQSLHWIARELARQQVPTKRGGQWYAGTVRYLLCNALYAEEVA
jgi:DNA invertase Pin-like site-specific DNA recombinase